MMRGTAVAGGRQDGTPGTLLRGNRARWKARSDTWNAFAGIPCQVGGGKVLPDTVRIRIRVRFRVRVNVRARAGQV